MKCFRFLLSFCFGFVKCIQRYVRFNSVVLFDFLESNLNGFQIAQRLLSSHRKCDLLLDQLNQQKEYIHLLALKIANPILITTFKQTKKM